MAAALAVALAVDGGVVDRPEILAVSRGTLYLDDGGVRVVRSGAWLSDPQLILTAQEVASLRTEVKVLRETPPAPPVSLVVTLALGAVGGLALGVILASAAR
jgi:hypothetical protein